MLIIKVLLVALYFILELFCFCFSLHCITSIFPMFKVKFNIVFYPFSLKILPSFVRIIKPWKIVWKKHFDTIQEAKKLESDIKSWKSKTRIQKLILDNNL